VHGCFSEHSVLLLLLGLRDILCQCKAINTVQTRDQIKTTARLVQAIRRRISSCS